MSSGIRLAWISSWDRVCGIADYSKVLWPSVRKLVEEGGGQARLISLDEFDNADQIARAIAEFQPSVVHYQHEYGLFGGKNPPGYWFPSLARRVATSELRPKQVATAHTVLDPKYRFQTKGRGAQIPLRYLANALLLPMLRKGWGQKTWGRMDGVIVHSDLQRKWIEAAGAKSSATIPHFVPVVSKGLTGLPPQVVDRALARPENRGVSCIVVFGFFTPEKGQDVVIEAMRHLKSPVFLVLAGGVRRASDQAYFDRCRDRVHELRLEGRVVFTGFVEPTQIDGLYARASLVVAPFRETSGSGSLVQALARTAPVLASNLPLNAELNNRVSGCVATFESEDAVDCARRIEDLLGSSDALDRLRYSSAQYAERYTPDKIALMHARYYAEVAKVRKT